MKIEKKKGREKKEGRGVWLGGGGGGGGEKKKKKNLQEENTDHVTNTILSRDFLEQNLTPFFKQNNRQNFG
jgi:hypothetical protein